MKPVWVITDWCSNYPFNKHIKSPLNGPDRTWGTFEDAEGFLNEYLGDNYDDDRQEYVIVPHKDIDT